VARIKGGERERIRMGSSREVSRFRVRDKQETMAMGGESLLGTEKGSKAITG
jgi:hypothetical protein